MTRRHFIKKINSGLKAAAAMNILAACTQPLEVKEPSKDKGLAYVPLNGKTLKDIAAQKMHHGNAHFLNPFSNTTHGNLWRVLHWKLFAENKFRQFYGEETLAPVSIDWRRIREDRGLSITYLKHASVLIKDMDQYILVDPVFSDIFWFIKDFNPFAFNVDEIPRPDHVLITHGHYDHLNTDSLAALGKGTHVLTPLGYDDIFKELAMHRRRQLDWFDTYRQNGREITLLPCNHWTMRNPLIGPNTSLWGSYLIKTKSGAVIYISGDTAYFDGFRQLGEAFDIDLAIFNLGAYEPRWFMAQSHTNPQETVQAFQELGAKHLMIVHWGTFRLGDEPVHFPPMDLRREMEKQGLVDRYVDIKHGQTLFYGRSQRAV